MGALGLLGLSFPAEFGGLEADWRTVALVQERMGLRGRMRRRGCSSAGPSARFRRCSTGWHLAWPIATGRDQAREASQAKVIASEALQYATRHGMQILATAGCAAESEMGRLWRDARLFSFGGIGIDEILRRMDAAGMERGFLIAPKVGRLGHRSTWRLPYEVVMRAVKAHPDRFFGLAGLDPTKGMKGVWEFQRAVEDYGSIGAHGYPHWVELAPDAARWYPFYAKCIELDVPVRLQIGQSMAYASGHPCRSVGRPITLDGVACYLPELKLAGIHVGIPWTEEMIAMAWKHKNVFIGCDAPRPTYWPESFVKYINSFGQDKAIFGTDFPVLDFERTTAGIVALGLKEVAKRKLFRDNAIRRYKLEERGVKLTDA